MEFHEEEGKTYGLHIPLHYAIEKLLEDEVIMLVNGGADVNECDISDGNSALHYSVRTDKSLEITKLLLTAGAEIDCRNEFGRTPLHEAVRNSSLGNTKLLLKHNADLEAEDMLEQTPLEWANHILKREGARHLVSVNLKIMEELLDWGIYHDLELIGKSFLCYKTYTESTLKIFSKHILKCKCANIPCHKELLVGESELDSFKAECMEELGRIRSTKVDSHSLYCVFSSCTSYFFDQGMESVIGSSELETNFPIYGSLLQATFARNQKRFELLNSAEVRFSEFLVNSQIFLPDMIVRKILTYIGNEDLLDITLNLSSLTSYPIPDLKSTVLVSPGVSP